MKGSCLCGDVRFRVTGTVHRTSYCHCAQCRKMSGHFFASLMTDQDGLVLESGEASLAWYPNQQHEHAFCVICGTTLFWRAEDAETVAVAMGTFDDPTGCDITTHVYTSEKGDYYIIPDDHEDFPRGSNEKLS